MQNERLAIRVPLHSGCTGCRCCIASESSISAATPAQSLSVTIHRLRWTVCYTTRNTETNLAQSCWAYVCRMSFNSRDKFQHFNLPRMLLPYGAGRMCSRLRNRKLLKYVTVKLTFCNSDIVCVCITISHYGSTIFNHMSRRTALNDKHHYICNNQTNQTRLKKLSHNTPSAFFFFAIMFNKTKKKKP